MVAGYIGMKVLKSPLALSSALPLHGNRGSTQYIFKPLSPCLIFSFFFFAPLACQVAVFSNARTTKAAAQNYGDMQYTAAFNVAFRAGSCMGFCLCAVGLLVLWLLLQFSKGLLTENNQSPTPFSSLSLSRLEPILLLLLDRFPQTLFLTLALALALRRYPPPPPTHPYPTLPLAPPPPYHAT